MTRDSSARWLSRDVARKNNLSLDTLENAEVGSYRSGLWLGPALRSAKLPKRSQGSDPDAIAELAARARVQIERAVQDIPPTEEVA